MVAAAQGSVLTPRWHSARLSPMQLGYLNSRDRINVVVAGRRSFKTEAAKRRLVRAAITFRRYRDGRFLACAPTHQQAKDIFWEDLKALVPDWALAGSRRDSISDGQLIIWLANGAHIRVAGLDKPQRIEGKDWDGGVVTEYGNCKPRVFDEVIRPMMTRGGWCDIEGVPEGRNHYFEMVNRVQDGAFRGSAYHHWTTEEVLHLWLGEELAAEELEDAQGSMDQLLYQQEYLARFISLEGQAYYAFDSGLNVRPVRYDPELALILCFDFNRSPGVCCFVQEHPPHRYPGLPANTHFRTVTAVVGELFIPRFSNTRKVCERIVERWSDLHRYELIVHGDATGGAGGSAKVEGSDWDIIRDMLQPTWGRHFRSGVPSENPPVRRRVNAMNSRLVAADGSVGMVIDPSAKNLIRDLEGVEADDSGEIVKEQGSPLTHISDGLGYYIAERFPVRVPTSDERKIRSGRARRRLADYEVIPGGGA